MDTIHPVSYESRINEYPDAVLANPSRQIRLLTLLPRRTGLISCSLAHSSFDELPEIKYEALSYAWGPEDTSHTIQLNGADFDVRENLFHALRYLRNRDAPRILWIDALCINQFDIRERNHQVEQMSDIYSKATQVLVWLGLATELSPVAFDFLRSATLFGAPSRNKLKDHWGWQALQDLYERDYWKRVWIVQEVCLASQIVIICGPDQIPWKPVTQLRQERINLFSGSLSLGEQNFMKSFLARVDLQREIRQRNGCVLWTVLETFRSSRCQVIHEPFSKVYGFLGLSNDCGSRGLPINYSKPVRELYEDVIMFYDAQYSRGNQSMEHGAQLMSLSGFLHGLLKDDAQPPDESTTPEELLHISRTPISRHVLVAEPWGHGVVHIAANKVMLIQKFISHKSDTEEMIKSLSGSDHLPSVPWELMYELDRGFAHLAITKVATVASSRSQLTSRVALWPVRYPPSVKIKQPSIFIADYPRVSSPMDYDWVVGVAPEGSQNGDICCTFLDSPMILVMRPVASGVQPHEPAQFELVGSAVVLDLLSVLKRVPGVQQMYERQRNIVQSDIRSRLTRLKPDKSLEVLHYMGASHHPYLSPSGAWPGMLTIDIPTLHLLHEIEPLTKACGFDKFVCKIPLG